MADGNSSEGLLSRRLAENAEVRNETFYSPQKLVGERFEQRIEIVDSTFPGGLTIEGCTFAKGLKLAAKTGRRIAFVANHFDGESVIAVNAERFSLHDRPLLDVRGKFLRASLQVELGDFGASFDDFHVGEDGRLLLTRAESDLWGPWANLVVTVHAGGKVLLSNLQNARASLAGSVVHEKASISIETYAGWLDLREVSIAEKGSVTLRNVRMDKVTMAHTNLGRVDFDRVIWPVSHRRRTTYDDLFYLQRWPHGSVREFSSATLRRITPDDVADAYRQLISYYEARREYELAEDFYVNEMEVRRQYGKNGRRSWLGAVLNSTAIYRFASLYGSSYRRAVCVLSGLIIAFSITFLFSGFDIPAKRHVDYSLRTLLGDISAGTLSEDFSTAFALTISIASLQKEKPAVPDGAGGSILASTAALTLTGQGALLLLALRRRFRRSSN
jgi:hypothetical protein